MCENGVLSVLQKVVHPETGKDIVSMGMVNSLKIEGNKISFVLQLAKKNDPFASALKKKAIKQITDEFGASAEVEVAVVADVTPHKAPVNKKSGVAKVKNIIAVASGKGGVGKSTIAVNLAVAMAKTGAKVGLIDADIFGPSIPKMMGLEYSQPDVIKEDGVELIYPIESYGVKVLSIGFFVDPQNALLWRGPMASNALKQLIHQGVWGELDFLFLDMPPGTSDIHLTLVQEVAVTGTVIVSTPQDVALADAIKGINMFASESINVPVLGLVENMAWFTPEELPNNKYYIFGKDGCKQLAEHMKVPLLGQIPIVQSIREGGDYGEPVANDPTTITGKAFAQLAATFAEQVDVRNNSLPPTQAVHTH